MSLPTTPEQLPYPPGDSGAIRRAADELRSTLAELATARRAALRVAAVCDGAHWRGEAFDVFRAVVDRKPLPEAIDHARSRMADAAAQLDTFAARFEETIRTIAWCRSRLLALGLGEGPVPEEHVAEVRRIAHDADAAWDDHRAALATVAEAFDRLDDEPTFARPPPSTFRRVAGVVEEVNDVTGEVLLGAGEALWELGTVAVQLGMFGHPVTAPVMWRRLWNARDQVGAVLAYAWDHPGDFVLDFGRAVIDVDTWTEDGVARWIGRRIPDLVLALATAGTGRIGTTAAASARTLRGARAADRVVDGLGVADHLGPGRRAIRGLDRLDRLGADTGRLDRMEQAGAFGPIDAALERVGRQLPGRLSDEIKGFTELPGRIVGPRLPASALVDHAGPTVQRRLDSVLSGGWTSRLDTIDGLVVGSEGLSPRTQAAMAGVLGADLTNRLADAGLVFSEVRTHAAEATEAGRR